MQTLHLFAQKNIKNDSKGPKQKEGGEVTQTKGELIGPDEANFLYPGCFTKNPN